MTTQMTPAQSRIVDPVLSNHVRGYRNQSYVGDILAPRVGVPSRGFRIIKFDRDSFRDALKAPRRAPGGAIPRVQFGYMSEPVALYQEALAGQVPIELQEEGQTVGVDVQMNTVSTTMDIILLRREIDTAALLTDPTQYAATNKIALTGTAKWTNKTNSDPRGVVDAGKEAIRRQTGSYPNRAVISPDAFNALKTHPQVLEQFKYTSDQSLTEAMAAQFFGLDQLRIGRAVHITEAGANADCWSNCMVMGFVHGAANVGMPSFAYTYGLNGYPLARQIRWDADTESWINPVIDERRPYIVGADAGYLIQGPV